MVIISRLYRAASMTAFLERVQAVFTNEELMNKYRTPFIIWANYDIKEKTIDKMSANYLSAYVMNEAGLETAHTRSSY